MWGFLHQISPFCPGLPSAPHLQMPSWRISGSSSWALWLLSPLVVFIPAQPGGCSVMPSAEKVSVNQDKGHQLRTPQSSGSRPFCPAHSHRFQISQILKHPLSYINQVTFNCFKSTYWMKGDTCHLLWIVKYSDENLSISTTSMWLRPHCQLAAHPDSALGLRKKVNAHTCPDTGQVSHLLQACGPLK